MQIKVKCKPNQSEQPLQSSKVKRNDAKSKSQSHKATAEREKGTGRGSSRGSEQQKAPRAVTSMLRSQQHVMHFQLQPNPCISPWSTSGSRHHNPQCHLCFRAPETKEFTKSGARSQAKAGCSQQTPPSHSESQKKIPLSC